MEGVGNILEGYINVFPTFAFAVGLRIEGGYGYIFEGHVVWWTLWFRCSTEWISFFLIGYLVLYPVLSGYACLFTTFTMTTGTLPYVYSCFHFGLAHHSVFVILYV